MLRLMFAFKHHPHKNKFAFKPGRSYSGIIFRGANDDWNTVSPMWGAVEDGHLGVNTSMGGVKCQMPGDFFLIT